MAIDKKIWLVGLLITTLIFISILFSNSLMDYRREKGVVQRMDKVIEEYEEMQSLLLMSEYFGEETTCAALSSILSNMNKELWELGLKIDAYRQATTEFIKDPFYLEQKRNFNRKEVLYFIMFKRMKEMCKVDKTVVSFFYRKKDYCPDCDAQAFVLEDIRRNLEKEGEGQKLALFSFDVDIDLSSINILGKFYNVTSYPCIIIEDTPYCGLYGKDKLVKELCKSVDLAICTQES